MNRGLPIVAAPGALIVAGLWMEGKTSDVPQCLNFFALGSLLDMIKEYRSDFINQPTSALSQTQHRFVVEFIFVVNMHRDGRICVSVAQYLCHILAHKPKLIVNTYRSNFAEINCC